MLRQAGWHSKEKGMGQAFIPVQVGQMNFLLNAEIFKSFLPERTGRPFGFVIRHTKVFHAFGTQMQQAEKTAE